MAKSIFLSRLLRSSFLNKYVVTCVAFTIWMLFFDKNNVPNQWRISREVHSLEKQLEIYNEKIAQAKIDRADLDQNVEKYAREKYLMHRSNEDVFIFED